MTRLVAYARGNEQSLSFWRRVSVPLTEMKRQHWFSSFDRFVYLDDMTVTEGQLLASEAIIFHNWEVRNPQEADIFLSAVTSARLSGKLPLWIYDLEDAHLLENPHVQEILPHMRLITVPNEYLRKEVFTSSRSLFQRVEVVPSTFDMHWLWRHRLELEPDAFFLAAYGDHDWAQLLPALFPDLKERLGDEIQRVFVYTDQKAVYEMCVHAELAVAYRTLTATNYPEHLYGIKAALCPREGEDSRDTCWLAEFSAIKCPVLVAEKSSYTDWEHMGSGAIALPLKEPKAWADVLVEWIASEEGEQKRRRHGEVIFDWGMTQRVQQVVNRYQALYRQLLPASFPGL